MPDRKGNEHRSNGQGTVRNPESDGRLKKNRAKDNK